MYFLRNSLVSLATVLVLGLSAFAGAIEYDFYSPALNTYNARKIIAGGSFTADGTGGYINLWFRPTADPTHPFYQPASGQTGSTWNGDSGTTNLPAYTQYSVQAVYGWYDTNHQLHLAYTPSVYITTGG